MMGILRYTSVSLFISTP